MGEENHVELSPVSTSGMEKNWYGLLHTNMLLQHTQFHPNQS